LFFFVVNSGYLQLEKANQEAQERIREYRIKEQEHIEVQYGCSGDALWTHARGAGAADHSSAGETR
jgi:hypothetical protein